MKLLSIIIPVYNEEQFVGQLLQKVVDLDLMIIWYDKEIIIVNDGSKDKSGSIVENFIAQHPDLGIKYTYQERKPDGSNTKDRLSRMGLLWLQATFLSSRMQISSTILQIISLLYKS